MLGMDCQLVLLGPIRFSKRPEPYYVHSAPNENPNRIQLTRSVVLDFRLFRVFPVRFNLFRVFLFRIFLFQVFLVRHSYSKYSYSKYSYSKYSYSKYSYSKYSYSKYSYSKYSYSKYSYSKCFYSDSPIPSIPIPSIPISEWSNRTRLRKNARVRKGISFQMSSISCISCFRRLVPLGTAVPCSFP